MTPISRSKVIRRSKSYDMLRQGQWSFPPSLVKICQVMTELQGDWQKKKKKKKELDIAVSSRWHGPCRCLFFFDLWPRNRRSDEEVTMETFACLPKDYMLTPLVWQFDVVWNLTFMMWHIWPFDPLNDLRSWWKKIHIYNGKMHCSKSSKKFLLSLVMEIKNYKAETGNDPCDPIWPLINLRSTTAI